MARFRRLMLCAAAALQAGAASLSYGPSSYAPSGAFPTQLYSSYYNDPTATTAQPQPVISDPVLVRGAYTIFFCEAFNGLIHNLLAQGLSARAHQSKEYTPGASRAPPPSFSHSVSLLNNMPHRRRFSHRMIPRTQPPSHRAPRMKHSCKPQ